MGKSERTVNIWQVWVETGGTFTDCIAVDPGGKFHRAKVLSSSALRGTVLEVFDKRRLRVQERWDAPDNFVRGYRLTLLNGTEGNTSATITAFVPHLQIIELAEELTVTPGTVFEVRFPYEAPILAARLVTHTLPDQPLPPMALRVATTRGTNALLTRWGTPPAFFVTTGFADVLEIGTQQRPDLFALDIVKPQPLTGTIVEVEERLHPDGTVFRPLNEATVAEAAQRLVAEGVTTAAVALIHSYRNPIHEQRVADILRVAGFTHISLSSELAPFIKLLPRAQTAVVNAYLSPILDTYLGGIQTALPPKETQSTLHVMTSAGGLVRSADFRAKDSLLSGPAGGVVGALYAGRAVGYDRIIAFDMGGTSTDVARCEGAFDYLWEHRIGDAHLVAPALAIESVAAGGGSICRADRHGLHVGPESAGADPGPACYGAGGPLTITDVNLLLGRVEAEQFQIPLNFAAAERAANHLLADLAQYTGETPERDAVLNGLLDIANERMVDAIRRISLRRGYDPAEYALVAFGGAGDQHACAVAARLGIRIVILPPDASLLSAWGLGQAEIERFAEKQILRPLNAEWEDALPTLMARLERDVMAAIISEGIDAALVTIRRRILTLRLAGQESGLEIEYLPGQVLLDPFTTRYTAVYGYQPATNRVIEVEAVRVVAGAATFASGMVPRPTDVAPIRTDTGWTATMHPTGATILTATDTVSVTKGDSPEVVRETLFASRFTAIAEEMGEALRRTALSTNVKERLDFSCALLDPAGNLVANAAHIPVHLGALGECVRRVREGLAIGPGDVIITNHPAWGGSHLPDVTLITPVFDDFNSVLLGWVANRSHHAEIGGTRPGSMPPDATTLEQEGVVLSPTYLIQGGLPQIDKVCQTLLQARYPTRAIGDNRADIEAALAANHRGSHLLRQLAREQEPTEVWEHMERVQTRAETILRESLRRLGNGNYTATEYLDDGTPITVRITVEEGTATIDFAGTGAVHPGNLNATPAIVMSAVLYVMRLLLRESLPLNAGLMRPITLHLPLGTIVNPHFNLDSPAHCPAVVGGNTETSQRIVDTLLKALGLVAGSQGTMNNTLWGNEHFGYYETVCGGAGATATAPGASAVHTHMTNTRITDTEILERRYPVRVERFAIRHGSGGSGQHKGGDGIIREITFLAPMVLSVLTQRRESGPYGLNSGRDGAPGHQRVVRKNGDAVELGSIAGCEVNPGDRLIMETPGGGGWGQL